MIRILRPAGDGGLISGRVFDDGFAASLAPELEVEEVEVGAWFRTIFGEGVEPDDPGVHAAWRSATAGFEFLCPNYRAIPLAPLLVYVRNQSEAPIRLLLIAHAPGVYALEWTLLAPLLRAGDLVIAPTRSAARAIEFLAPTLAPFVRNIPHPIPPWQGSRAPVPGRVVSLTRLHRSKLVHRQIEAMALLHERGVRGVTMRIAGPTCESGETEPSAYARSLAAKIRRLHLEESVELVGALAGADKRRFLGEAELLINLSVSIEESFGKSIAEALGAGVPVLVTRWDGLPETVGTGGRCVPVQATTFGMDVSAASIADAIESSLGDPPGPEVCRQEALRCDPRVVRQQYADLLRSVLSASRGAAVEAPGPDLPAAPAGGLLADTAPLEQFSWRELFELHVRDAMRLRDGLPGTALGAASAADALRGLLLQGIQPALARLFAGAGMHGADRRTADEVATATGASLPRKVTAAAMSGSTLASRLACLGFLTRIGDAVALRRGLDAMYAHGLQAAGVTYFEIEALHLEGSLQSAFARSVEEEDEACWGELTADRVHQLAVVCRAWGRPGLALPRLRAWLEAFPDGPDAAMIHLDRSANAAALGSGFTDEAVQALESVRTLLGDSVDLAPIEATIYGSQAPPWAAIADQLGPIAAVTPVGRSRSTFVVETAAGRRVVKRMTHERPPERYLEQLERLSQLPVPLCPRPLGAVIDEPSWYVLTEWVDGSTATSAAIDEPARRKIVELLVRLRESTVVPEWPLESMWLDRLERHLADERAASILVEHLRSVVPGGPRTLAHGDFSLQNFVWAAEGPVLIDWEHIGGASAGFDAGWLLAHASLGVGPGPRDRLFGELVEAGFERAHLRWFETLGLLRLLHRARTLAIEPGMRIQVLAAVRGAVDERARATGWEE